MRNIYLAWAIVTAAAAAESTSAPVINADNLQSFFDEEVPRLMDKTHVAGMAVAAVHDGNVAFKKGYGHANVETNRGVDPDQTLFRVGSISKLFTWAAIFQLVERGKLDLGEDINTYLKLGGLRISDDDFPDQPITLSHIMSHTAGFEDFLFNLFVKDAGAHETLEESIKGKSLRRLRPPGVEISYSNYGAMLAGYIVQLASGIPFEIYVEEHIFKPLDMKRSTFRQPLPSRLNNSLSESYSHVGGNFTRWPHFEFVQGTPAGGMSSPASDMAKFLLASLSPDCGGILKEETVRKFHSTLFRPDPRVNGMAHGMIEMDINGQKVLGHAGDLIYHHSVFAFIQNEGFGIFFSTNTGGTSAAINYLLYQAIMDRFFPSPTGKEVARNFEACTDLSLYPGTYLANRRSESDMTKLISLGMSLRIQKTKNETLKTFNFLLQEYQEYIEIDPGVFQEVDGQGKLVFLQGSNETIEGVIWAGLPIITFKRPPLWELPILSAGISVVAHILVLWVLFLPPFGLAKVLSKKKTKHPDGAVAAANLALAVALLNAIFVFYLFTIDDDFIFVGVPPAWPFLIPWVTYFVSLFLPWQCWVCWKRGFWRCRDRIAYSAFTTMMQLWFYVLWYWRVVPHFW